MQPQLNALTPLNLQPIYYLQRMDSIYTPQTMLLNVACAEMMAHYGLPHSGTSGSAPGWGADLPAAGTLWMNHLTALMGKVGLAPCVGGNFDSLAFSPTLAVYSNEVIRQARFFKQGFTVNDESVALDEIESIGPGGNFLTSGRTLRYCRKINFSSSIWPQLTLDKWRAQDSPRADEVLRRRTCRLLAESRPPEDHGELSARGETFIRQMKT